MKIHFQDFPEKVTFWGVVYKVILQIVKYFSTKAHGGKYTHIIMINTSYIYCSSTLFTSYLELYLFHTCLTADSHKCLFSPVVKRSRILIALITGHYPFLESPLNRKDYSKATTFKHFLFLFWETHSQFFNRNVIYSI